MASPTLALGEGIHQFILEVVDTVIAQVAVAEQSGGSSELEPFDNYFNLSEEGTVSIPCRSEIFIRVRDGLVKQLNCAGSYAVWDGTNQSNVDVSVGIYWVLEEGQEIRKISVVK